ncbi:ferric reductase NAD binding domain-containing protein [Mycena capillaripes]|nr:ferric reductase NAD binding domain-containing protein [Mycena capillaripes]
MPPSQDSISLHAPSIRSIYSAWSSVGLTIGTISLDAATKPLIGLMLHQKASKNIAGNRGVPLEQESARSLVEYLLYRDTFKRTRLMVMREFFDRAGAGEDMGVITDAFDWCLGNLFLMRCSAEERRAHDILEHLSKHHSLSALCHHFTEYQTISPKHQPIPEPGVNDFDERGWHKILSLHPTYLRRVFIYNSAIELQIWGPSFQYTPGQWLFLQVPELSRWRWHPFTIASSPHDPYISIYIRVRSDDEWIRALAQHLSASLPDVASPTETTGDVGAFRDEVLPVVSKTLPAVRIYGPFGGFAEDVFRVEFAVLIGAGIGAAPFISILRDLSHRLRTGKPSTLRRLEFIWIARDFESLGWFSSVLCEVEAAAAAATAAGGPDFLRIKVYLIARLKDETVWNLAVNYVDAERDLITLLRTPTSFGRPDFKSIYGEFSSAIQDGSYTKKPRTVKTYFCGPEPLAKLIQNAIAFQINGDVKFTFEKVPLL